MKNFIPESRKSTSIDIAHSYFMRQLCKRDGAHKPKRKPNREQRKKIREGVQRAATNAITTHALGRNKTNIWLD